jgi:hypothetical protein
MDLVFAYIDPGAGSLIVQAVIAGLVALPIFFRSHLRRAVQAVRGSESSGSSRPTGRDDGAKGA